MNGEALLRAFDEQIRREPNPRPPADGLERERRIVRITGAEADPAGVVWSDLDSTCADELIAAQIARFAGREGPWEWKHYSYDQPEDLPERLIAVSFEAEPTETLLVAEIAELDIAVDVPDGIVIEAVHEPADIRTLVAFQEQVFGDGPAGMERRVRDGVEHQPSTIAALLATFEGSPVAAGRIEFNLGTEFAGLWGGCTHEAWRGRGLMRALLAHGADLAESRGFRYLQADAVPESRRILEWLGFVVLAETTPYIYRSGLG